MHEIDEHVCVHHDHVLRRRGWHVLRPREHDIALPLPGHRAPRPGSNCASACGGDLNQPCQLHELRPCDLVSPPRFESQAHEALSECVLSCLLGPSPAHASTGSDLRGPRRPLLAATRWANLPRGEVSQVAEASRAQCADWCQSAGRATPRHTSGEAWLWGWALATAYTTPLASHDLRLLPAWTRFTQGSHVLVARPHRAGGTWAAKALARTSSSCSRSEVRLIVPRRARSRSTWAYSWA